MKKTIMLLLVFVMLFSLTAMVFAQDDGNSVFVTINGKTYKGQESNDQTHYGEPAVDSVPHRDPVTKGALTSLAVAAVVTDSYVHRVQLTEDPEYPNEYVSEGYVTMMDGSNPAYHYSRAEMWYGGSLKTTSGNRFGYGEVWATSWPTPYAGTAKIFYGQ
ncbi:MAG: hypothetical protein K0Q99_1881 [Clostridia bacterium]|jgi:hypothetical protein|nr:hypothetical protein [Clostridia bacterium]